MDEWTGPPRGNGAAAPQGALRAIHSSACPRSWRTCGPRRLRRQSQACLVAAQSAMAGQGRRVVGSSNGAPSQTDGGANATLVGRTDGDPEPTRPHQSRASSARPVAEGSGQPRQNASTATQAAIRKEHCVIGGPDVESGDQTDSTRADNQPNAAPTQPSQRGSAPVPSSTAAAAAMRRSGLSPSSDPGTTG